MDFANGPGDLGRRREGEEVLAVDLAPKRDPAPEFRGQRLEPHAEDLGVQGMDAELNEVGNDVEDVAVGMEEDVFPVAAGNGDIVPIKRFENLPPERRRDQERGLGAPIVHDAQRVHLRPGPRFGLGAVENMNAMEKLEQLRGALGQVQIEGFGRPQKLEALEGPEPDAGQDEAVLAAAEGVDCPSVQVEIAVGRPELVQISPVDDQGFVDLADEPALGVLENAAPLVDEDSGPIAFGRIGQKAGLSDAGRADDVVGISVADGPKLPGIMLLGPRQEPELEGHPGGPVELDRLFNEVAGRRHAPDLSFRYSREVMICQYPRDSASFRENVSSPKSGISGIIPPHAYQTRR